jgi:lysyl-tRNA synthetase class I
MKYISAIIVMFAMLFSGCAVLESIAKDENKLAVQYATLKVIDGDTQKANQLKGWITEARNYVNTSAEVTVSYLADEARVRISGKISDPADMLLAMAVLNEAERRIRERLGEGLLEQEQRVNLLTVFDWIEEVL